MKKYIFPAVFATLTMTACTNNNEILSTNEEGIQTISAEIMQPILANNSSRIVVSGNTSDNIRPLQWRADDPLTTGSKNNEADKIYVYDSEGNAARFTYSEGKDGSNGVFTRDKNIGSNIQDIKEALSVTSFGLPSQLPISVGSPFSYMRTMMYHKGAENVPMYGEMGNDGILRFKAVTGLVELVIDNLVEISGSKNNKLGIKIEAFDPSGNKKFISAKSARLKDSGNSKTLEFVEKPDNIICVNVQANMLTDNKLYFPLVCGEYSRIDVTIYRDLSFKEQLSNTVSISRKEGKAFNIETKLYSFKITKLKKIK